MDWWIEVTNQTHQMLLTFYSLFLWAKNLYERETCPGTEPVGGGRQPDADW